MSNEPEKNIEERLQDYAQKRREEAGARLELHAVTRKLLQDEVARAYVAALPAGETAEEKPPVNWFARFWPRLSFGTAVFASLALVAFVIFMDARLKENGPVSYSMTETAPANRGVAPKDSDADKKSFADAVQPATPAAPAAPAPAFAETQELRRNDRNGASALGGALPSGNLRQESPPVIVGQKLEVLEAAKNSPAPDQAGAEISKQQEATKRMAELAPEKARKLEVAATEGAMARELKDTRAQGPAAAGAPMPPPSELAKAKATAEPSSRLASAMENQAAVAGRDMVPAVTTYAGASKQPTSGGQQRFTQAGPATSYRRNLSSPPFPKVMTSFSIEVTGDRVRITDADGSVYDGHLVTTGDAERKKADDAQATARRGDLSDKETAQGGVGFVVNGTNRTYNQQVTFRGSLVTVSGDAMRREAEADRGRVAGERSLARPAVATPRTAQDEQLQRAAQPLQSTQIRGRATVGRNEYDLNAVPER